MLFHFNDLWFGLNNKICTGNIHGELMIVLQGIWEAGRNQEINESVKKEFTQLVNDVLKKSNLSLGNGLGLLLNMERFNLKKSISRQIVEFVLKSS